MLLLPFVESRIELRVGAGWNISMVIGVVLYFILLTTCHQFSENYLVSSFVAIIAVILCGIVGYVLFEDKMIGMVLESQIRSPALYVITETIRVVGLVGYMFTSHFLLSKGEIWIRAQRMFCLGGIGTLVVGVYDRTAGLILDDRFLVNPKAASFQTLRLYGTMYEPSQYGAFGVCLICLYLLWKRVRYHRKEDIPWLWDSIILIGLIIIVCSISRFAMLMGCVVLIVNLLSRKIGYRSLIKTVILVLFVAGGIMIYQLMGELIH